MLHAGHAWRWQIGLGTHEKPLYTCLLYTSLLVLVGPTAVGKTALSLALAARFNGEIVSADSRLFYRGLDIGTAKPTAAERAAAPHHLIDVADPGETISLGQYLSLIHILLLDFGVREPIVVIENGIELEPFLRPRRPRAKADFGLPDDAFLLVYICLLYTSRCV